MHSAVTVAFKIRFLFSHFFTYFIIIECVRSHRLFALKMGLVRTRSRVHQSFVDIFSIIFEIILREVSSRRAA